MVVICIVKYYLLLSFLVHGQPSRPDIITTRDYTVYSMQSSLLDAVVSWNPDDPEVPVDFTETIRIFDYSNITERNMAMNIRNLELPFKLFNVPDVALVVDKWTDEYLLDMMKDDKAINTITSKSNHFMFWRKSKEKGISQSAKRPVGRSDMSFKEWLALAKRADREKLPPHAAHYYFRKNDPASKKGALTNRYLCGEVTCIQDLHILEETWGYFLLRLRISSSPMWPVIRAPSAGSACEVSLQRVTMTRDGIWWLS